MKWNTLDVVRIAAVLTLVGEFGSGELKYNENQRYFDFEKQICSRKVGYVYFHGSVVAKIRLSC